MMINDEDNNNNVTTTMTLLLSDAKLFSVLVLHMSPTLGHVGP